jgi:hypothetical protein
VPANVKLAKVRAFFTYSRKRLEFDPDKPIMPQWLDEEDWTALVRVVDLAPGGAALSTTGQIPEDRQHEDYSI